MYNKKGSIDISFGMIFSIILIIAFIAVAIYVIMYFLNLQKCTTIGLFKQGLDNEIDRARNSDGYSHPYSNNLPGELTYVCFGDLTMPAKGQFKQYFNDIRYKPKTWNMFFIPGTAACDKLEGFAINYIDIKKITSVDNPYCIKNIRGNVTINIQKPYGNSVTLN